MFVVVYVCMYVCMNTLQHIKNLQGYINKALGYLHGDRLLGLLLVALRRQLELAIATANFSHCLLVRRPIGMYVCVSMYECMYV